MLTHADMLRRCASAYGSRIAIVSEERVEINYLDLDALTNAVANSLASRGFGRVGNLRGGIAAWAHEFDPDLDLG